MTDRIRVSPTPATALLGDEPVDIDVAASGVESSGPGRAVVHGDRHARAVIGQDRAASHGRPRIIEVVVGGWRFELEVEPVRRAEIRARATRDRAVAGRSGPVEIRAMIPGRVVSVAVAVGDRVAPGETLLVVEAMKMQNELRARHAGTVERVTVGAGDTIELGQVLVALAEAS